MNFTNLTTTFFLAKKLFGEKRLVFIEKINETDEATNEMLEILAGSVDDGNSVSKLEKIKTTIFDGLSDSEFDELNIVLSKREEPSIGNIFEIDDESDSFYIIQRGKFEVVDKNNKVIATLEASDIFGEIGFLENAPRFYTVRAIEADSKLIKIDRDLWNNVITKMTCGPRVEANINKIIRHRELKVENDLNASLEELKILYAKRSQSAEKMKIFLVFLENIFSKLIQYRINKQTTKLASLNLLQKYKDSDKEILESISTLNNHKREKEKEIEVLESEIKVLESEINLGVKRRLSSERITEKTFLDNPLESKELLEESLDLKQKLLLKAKQDIVAIEEETGKQSELLNKEDAKFTELLNFSIGANEILKLESDMLSLLGMTNRKQCIDIEACKTCDDFKANFEQAISFRGLKEFIEKPDYDLGNFAKAYNKTISEIDLDLDSLSKFGNLNVNQSAIKIMIGILFQNAIQHGSLEKDGKNGIEIKCKTIIDEDKKQFKIEIESNGPGVAIENDMFDLKINTDSKSIDEKVIDGYFGLALIRHYMKIFGGEMLVESNPDEKGLKVSLVFSLKNKQEEPIEKSNLILPKAKKLITSTRGKIEIAIGPLYDLFFGKNIKNPNLLLNAKGEILKASPICYSLLELKPGDKFPEKWSFLLEKKPDEYVGGYMFTADFKNLWLVTAETLSITRDAIYTLLKFNPPTNNFAEGNPKPVIGILREITPDLVKKNRVYFANKAFQNYTGDLIQGDYTKRANEDVSLIEEFLQFLPEQDGTFGIQYKGKQWIIDVKRSVHEGLFELINLYFIPLDISKGVKFNAVV